MSAAASEPPNHLPPTPSITLTTSIPRLQGKLIKRERGGAWWIVLQVSADDTVDLFWTWTLKEGITDKSKGKTRWWFNEKQDTETRWDSLNTRYITYYYGIRLTTPWPKVQLSLSSLPTDGIPIGREVNFIPSDLFSKGHFDVTVLDQANSAPSPDTEQCMGWLEREVVMDMGKDETALTEDLLDVDCSS
jgi:hypothetical protein